MEKSRICTRNDRSKVDVPFFSVVIPLYNKQPHISRAINSVLKQTFQDFELIIVNDASTDGSVEEIQKFDDPRIILLHRDQPGPGGYAARNTGIKEAHGGWIAFLDADDKWLPEHLSRYCNLIAKFPNVGVCSSGWEVVGDEAQNFNSFYLANQTSDHILFSFDDYLNFCIDGRGPICSSVVAIRKDLLVQRGGFPDGKAFRGGDLYTWLMVMESAQAIWSNHVGAQYFVNSVNMVTKSAKITPDLFVSMVHDLYTPLTKQQSVMVKKYSNRLLLSGWLLMFSNSGEKCFSLAKYGFWTGEPFLFLVFIFLTYCPAKILVFLKKIYSNSKCLKYIFFALLVKPRK